MASQNLNVGTSANSNDGDTLRGAFIKLKQMFAEVYGQTYSEQGDLSGTDFKINESKLQLTASGTASDDGKVLTYDHATGGFSWEDAFTGTIGDITGIVAGFGLTGSSLDENEATLNVVAGTGITVTEDAVSLATSVQDEISANTLKTGITATQISEIAANTLKHTDQTVVLTEGANVTITGTYPNFTIASDDVVGAVTSVNGDTGVVVLDTDDVAEGSSNLYDKTVTLTEGANVTITGTYPDFTIASDDVVGAVTSVNGAAGVVVLDTADVAENTNLYYTDARVAANSAVAANTLKTGITLAQADDITDNNAKVSNATHTGDVTGDVALTIADNVVNAAKLDVAGNGAAGQLLQSDGDGSMTWVTGVTGDITAVTAGDGIAGGGTGGDVTISLDSGVAGDGLTFNTGVLSVDTIQTGDVADDAITSPKLAEFDDSFTAGTSGDIIVSNGTDFIHATMSGDATIVSGGAITIADDAIDTDKILDDAVTADKLADSINTDIANALAKVSNVTTDLGKTVSGTGFTITSSDGDDVDLSLADTDNWGLMSDEMFDAQVLNTAKLTNADHTGEVTGSGALTITDGAVVTDRLAADAVTTVKILDANVTTGKLADDSVTNAKLGVEYTASSALTSGSAVAVDTSLGDVFTMTAGHSHTFNFTNVVIGDVKTLEITGSGGSYTSAFGTVNGSSCTFNKIGGAYSDTAAKQLIQIKWTATNAAWYQISPIAS